MSDTTQCELCGATVEEVTLTTDSHPEGPNHVVGECCSERDSESPSVYGNPETCGVIDAPFNSECGDETVVMDQEVIESLGIVYQYGYCEEHRGWGEEVA